MGFMQQFQQPQQFQNSGAAELKRTMQTLRNLMRGDHSQRINELLQTNPDFARLVNSGQTLRDAYKAYGYDIDEVMSLINLGS